MRFVCNVCKILTTQSLLGESKSLAKTVHVPGTDFSFMLDIFCFQQLLKGPFFPSMRPIFHIPVVT